MPKHSVTAFLARKDIEVSFQRYAIDALSAMAQGLFASLLIGTILTTVGDLSGVGFFNEIGTFAKSVAGPAMAVAIGYALRAPALVLFSLAAVGYAANAAGGAGGPLAVLVITIAASELGKEVAMVDCRWIVASLAEGRILREPGWTVENFWNDTVEGELPLQLHKCKDGLTSAGEWTARYSQCDLNGHLNNAFYLDLVCDALPLEVMRKGPVTFASINYHREIPMGETAEVFYAPSADGWYVVGKHNGQTSFECYLEVGKTNV